MWRKTRNKHLTSVLLSSSDFLMVLPTTQTQKEARRPRNQLRHSIRLPSKAEKRKKSGFGEQTQPAEMYLLTRRSVCLCIQKTRIILIMGFWFSKSYILETTKTYITVKLSWLGSSVQSIWEKQSRKKQSSPQQSPGQKLLFGGKRKEKIYRLRSREACDNHSKRTTQEETNPRERMWACRVEARFRKLKWMKGARCNTTGSGGERAQVPSNCGGRGEGSTSQLHGEHPCKNTRTKSVHF